MVAAEIVIVYQKKYEIQDVHVIIMTPMDHSTSELQNTRHDPILPNGKAAQVRRGAGSDCMAKTIYGPDHR